VETITIIFGIVSALNLDFLDLLLVACVRSRRALPVVHAGGLRMGRGIVDLVQTTSIFCEPNGDSDLLRLLRFPQNLSVRSRYESPSRRTGGDFRAKERNELFVRLVLSSTTLAGENLAIEGFEWRVIICKVAEAFCNRAAYVLYRSLVLRNCCDEGLQIGGYLHSLVLWKR